MDSITPGGSLPTFRSRRLVLVLCSLTQIHPGVRRVMGERWLTTISGLYAGE